MAKKFRDLVAQMPAERQARIAAKTRQLIGETPLQALRRALDLARQQVAATLGIPQLRPAQFGRRPTHRRHLRHLLLRYRLYPLHQMVAATPSIKICGIDSAPNHHQQSRGFDQHVLERRRIRGGLGAANEIVDGLIWMAGHGRFLTALTVDSKDLILIRNTIKKP